MPFQYEPYESRNLGAILQLMQGPAHARAQAARESAAANARAQEIRGQNTAQLVGTLGNLAGDVVGQAAQYYSPDAQALRAQRQALADERQQGIKERQIAQHQQQAIDGLLKEALTKDPETGIVTYDRNKLQTGLASLNLGHLTGEYVKLLDSSDAAVKTARQAQADALKQIATVVDATGNDAAVFQSEVTRAIANGVITERMAAPYIDAARRDPAHVARITGALLGKTDASTKLMERDPAKDLVNPQTGAIVAAGTPKADKAPTVGSFEDYLGRFAASRHLTPAQLSAADVRTAKAQYEAAGRAPEQEPLVPIIGPDGQSVLVPRSQAVGKRPANAREQGRPVTSGDAGKIADFDTSLDDLNTLQSVLTAPGSTGVEAKVRARLPNWANELTGGWGTEAKGRQAVIDRVKQVIGKTLEGGVLRKEDETKYERILPTIGDTPEVVRTKLDGLWQAIHRRRQTTLDALQDAGYDVTKFEARPPRTKGAASGAPAANAKDPMGIR